MDKRRGLLRKTLVIGIILLFIGISINTSTGYGVNKKSVYPISNGNTLYVGGSGPGNYSKIQDAIDNASLGDTVFVYSYSSPYYENVYIKYDKTINLIGENKYFTVIDGNKSGHVVRINGVEGVTISGFTIRNSGEGGSGIENYGGGEYNLIEGNIFSQNYNGYNQYGGYRNIIRDNKFHNNTYRGIWVGYDLESCFEGNHIFGGVYGMRFGRSSASDIFNNTILSCSEAGIWINLCNGIEVLGNKLNNNKYGILSTGDSKGLKISSNLISANKYGIHLEGTSYSIVKKNNFIGNEPSASFGYSFLNRWSRNYWDRPRLFPKPIFGTIGIPSKEIQWINFDWRPALKPYDI